MLCIDVPWKAGAKNPAARTIVAAAQPEHRTLTPRAQERAVSDRTRRVAGLLFAPGAPALLVYLAGFVARAVTEVEWSAAMFVTGTYLSTGAVGIPTHVLLHRYGITVLRGYVIVGTLIGMVCWALIFIPATIVRWQTTSLSGYLLLRNLVVLALVALICSALASAAFWLIAIRRRSARP
jgi:hypothetical protein